MNKEIVVIDGVRYYAGHPRSCRGCFYYSPRISEEEYNAWAAKDLVNRLFKGSARNLVAALVKSDGLTEEDIGELRQMFKVEDE